MTRIGMIAVVVVAMVLAGCGDGSRGKDPIAGSASEAQKAKLLKELDARFENPQAHYQLGKLYHQDGLLERAEYHYNTAIGFDATNRPAQAAMIKLLKDRRDPERAQIAAEMYMTQASVSGDALMNLGRAFQREGLDDYALTCYQKAQGVEPNSASVYKQLGYFYLAKGDKVQAESNLRRSFELNPTQAEVAGELGRMGVQVQVPPKAKTDVLAPVKNLFGGQTDETVKE